MTKDEIIKALRDMAKYPTVTLPRDCAALRAAADFLAQPHETTLKEFNQLIHDDPKYHIWAKEKEALADPMREVQRLGQEIEQEPTCPDCKAEVLYECVACSSNNYPPKETT